MLKLYAADPIPKKEKAPLKEGILKLYGAEEAADEEAIDPRDALSQIVQDTGFGVAQGATFNLADEAYGLGASALGEGSYEENRDVAREEWQKARERSPVAAVSGEILGATLSPGSKLLGGGSALKGIGSGVAEGALQSYGATDKESGWDQAKEVAIGAGIGGTVGGVTNALTSKFSKSPTAVRSEVLGIKPKDYRVSGPGDRKKIVERINETGMLKNRKMEYNPKTLKFEPRFKNKFTLDELEKNTEDRLLERSQDAVAKLQGRKEAEFGTILANTKVMPSELNKMAQEIADEYSKRGLSKGPLDRIKAAGDIATNIKHQLEINGGSSEFTSLKDLDAVKRMAQEDVKNFSKSLGELGDSEELARITARKLKELVETKVGNKSFKEINSAQHDFLTVGGDLLDKIKKLELEDPTRQSYGRTGILDSAIEGFSGSSQGRLNTARAKEMYQSLPQILNPAKAVAPYMSQELPGAMYRQGYQGNMKGNWRNPGSVEGLDMTPMEIAKARLPRTTKGLLENKELVLKKLALSGVPDDLIDTVAQALNDDPESVESLGAMVTMQFPTLFSKSKYNMFDGKILDPQQRAKAADDTSKRSDIGSVERAKIISELNKTGKYLGE